MDGGVWLKLKIKTVTHLIVDKTNILHQELDVFPINACPPCLSGSVSPSLWCAISCVAFYLVGPRWIKMIHSFPNSLFVRYDGCSLRKTQPSKIQKENFGKGTSLGGYPVWLWHCSGCNLLENVVWSTVMSCVEWNLCMYVDGICKLTFQKMLSF